MNVIELLSFFEIDPTQISLNESPKSLQAISSEVVRKNISCENALQVLLFASRSNLKSVVNEAKYFIFTNNEVMKTSWKTLETTNPEIFLECAKIMLNLN